MNIAVRATEKQKDELLQKKFNNSVSIKWLDKTEDLQTAADACFDLSFNDADIHKNIFTDYNLVFVNAVNCTCREIGKKNYVRINAWPGFLNRSVIEIAITDENYKPRVAEIFNALGWKYVWAPDDYGFISARIIAMIINEAYYALQEKVSTSEQIDIAMKLGTNYPYGPFEWSEKIGIGKIYTLLQKLSAQNKRYTIAELLQSTALKNKIL